LFGIGLLDEKPFLQHRRFEFDQRLQAGAEVGANRRLDQRLRQNTHRSQNQHGDDRPNPELRPQKPARSRERVRDAPRSPSHVRLRMLAGITAVGGAKAFERVHAGATEVGWEPGDAPSLIRSRRPGPNRHPFVRFASLYRTSEPTETTAGDVPEGSAAGHLAVSVS